MGESWYARRVFPFLLDKACATPAIKALRGRVVPEAEGRVIEIGLGTGLNLPFYDVAKVKEVIGVDPAGGVLRKAEARGAAAGFPVSLRQLSGEELPFDDQDADCVVCTFSLCTIPDPLAALKEMRRVLKPGGRLLFAEHGASPDPGVKAWQDRLNGVWGRVAGGCNMNRPILELISGAGFRLDNPETGYMPKTPKILGYGYSGIASVG